MAGDTKSLIDSLNLDALDEKGEPVKERMADVKAAIGIFHHLLKADEGSSIARARIDAMFDNAPPYDGAKLAASGQSLKTNLNFGEAQRLIDIAMSSYIDLEASLEVLVEVFGTMGEPDQRIQFQDIVAQELTYLIRSNPEYYTNYLRLCTQFLKHGVSIAYFDNPDDYHYQVGGFTDILIPRQSKATEAGIEVAVGRRPYALPNLMKFIENEEAAKKVGWNPTEIKRIVVENVRTTGRNDTSSGSVFADYEALAAEVKNNDIYEGIHNPTVEVLHFWVREMDGTYSHYICAKDNPKDFIYKKVSRFKSAQEAFIFFANGVGTNGTYHSIRGLGQRIHAHIQVLNRLRCQMVDGAMLGSSVMLQPDGQRAMDELNFTYYGGYSILSPNVNIVEKPIANMSQAVMPALNDITQQLMMNADTTSTYGPDQVSPYRNRDQVALDSDVLTRISGSQINLFYSSQTRLLREQVRRIVQNKKNRPEIAEFYARCEARGVPAEFIQSLDTDRTRAVRAIGDGSKVNRSVALRELQGISGQFDEVGRRNLTRDIVATRVGYDLANRYVPANVETRPTTEIKVAILENAHLSEGRPVPVVASELHGQHLDQHLPEFNALIEALNTGQADPMQSLPILQAFYQHVADTIDAAFGDPNLQEVIAQANQLLQFAEEQINNVSKHIEKLQRDGVVGGDGRPQEGVDPNEAKIADMERVSAVKLDIMRREADLRMSIKQQEADQSRAIRDADAALKFREGAIQ